MGPHQFQTGVGGLGSGNWDWDQIFQNFEIGIRLGIDFQNFGIGIGLGITTSGQNPKKSQEIQKVVIEILNNLISMNYLLFFFFPVEIFDCKLVFQPE